jgi:hypothetical protein
MFCVHPQEKNGRSAYGGDPFDLIAGLAEVVAPNLATGVKQIGHPSGIRIDAGEIRAFDEIAVVTRQSQIVDAITATVLTRDDMFNVITEIRLPTFLHPAVFAAVLGL